MASPVSDGVATADRPAANDRDPLTGRPRAYRRSVLDDLPYPVRVLMAGRLELSPELDSAAVYGVAAPDAACGSCWGCGVAIDDDGTITGQTGALYVCGCVPDPPPPDPDADPTPTDEDGQVWFRFRDRNPITGLPYLRSLWDALPYWIGVLVTEQWSLTPQRWDHLVAAGQAAGLVGTRAYPVPLTAPPGTPLPAVLPTAGLGGRCRDMCPDCVGRGVLVDHDGQMTGHPGAVHACVCAMPEPARPVGVWA
jgi:hypothetical protein